MHKIRNFKSLNSPDIHDVSFLKIVQNKMQSAQIDSFTKTSLAGRTELPAIERNKHC